MQLRSLGLPLATVLLGSLLGGSGSMVAQSFPAAGVSAPTQRVLGDWRGSPGVAIARSKPSRNPAAIDLGPAPANQVLGRMLLLLAPAPAQQQALAAELGSLQNPSSPSYHHWLTPQAFARSYANNPSDVAAVAAWLESQGFAVAPLPAGLGWIEFSGTVAQVEQAFGVQVDMVAISGARAPAISALCSPRTSRFPAHCRRSSRALSRLTAFSPRPRLPRRNLSRFRPPILRRSLLPPTPRHSRRILPRSFSTSLRSPPQSVNGAGQTIAIVSRSNVNSADVAAFRSAFALPASPLRISLNGTDPGLADDQAEATVAASWAGAAAPGAQILLAPAATTTATDGVDLSLASVIDQDLANVIAVGYSACEAALSPAHQAFYSALYQQAAAEGITVIVASGDGGAAACTPAGITVPVDTGFAVNALASTPWNTAVGVVAYGAGGAAAGTSALTAWSPVNAADPAYASGGGSSALYARKIWQPVPAELATGSAAANHRLLPDLALPTALDSTTNPGLAFCLSSSATASGCMPMRSGGSGVATAFFAGVAALINQKNGVQGNLAPSLYATSRAFNDVAQGTSKLACVPGSPGCDASDLIGYAAGSGYDLATGLGVPDVEKLVTELASPFVTGATPTITLSISPVQASHTYNPSALVTFTATVVDPAGAGIPTGTANLYDTTNYDVLTPNFPLTSSGSAATGSSAAIGPLQLSSLYNYSGPQTYKLGGHYSGDSTYPGPDSGYLLTVIAALSPTVLTITPSTTSPGSAPTSPSP